jgi:hypothetical protein
MATQNSTKFHSTIEFLSKYCKSNNHINCSRIWTGIGFQVICTCSCHNNDSDDNDTIQIRRHLNE